MFCKNEYFSNIINKLDDTLDKFYPIGMALLLLIGIVRGLTNTNDMFFVVDFSAAFLFLLLTLFRNKMEVILKSNMAAILLSSVGILSFMKYGSLSTGIPLLILSNLIMIIFGSERNYLIHFSVTSLFIFSYTIITNLLNLKPFYSYNYFNIIIFLILIEVIRVSLFTIKKYLLSNIETLNKNMRETEIIVNELAIQNAAIKSNEKEIYNLAFMDQLTGLPKRSLFEKHVKARFDHVPSGTMMIIDLKEFKLLNSLYGTEVGDQILTLIGDVIKENMDKMYACRLNGNEFALWLEHGNIDFIREEMKKIEEDFRVKSKEIFKYNRVQFHVSYVAYPEDGTCFNDLIDKLLIALNYCKNSQAVEYIKYEPFMMDKLQFENNLKRLLERSILSKSFDVVYQEKYDSKRHRVIGVEALARWTSDELGPISPNVFIPMITKHNMISSFERVIIEKVFNDYSELITKYGDIKIGINISPDHIVSKFFSDFINDAAKMYGVNKGSILLEITEEVMIKGITRVESVLNALRNDGFKISLDDFGSGYSSLNYLAKLPFDEIKIDKAFVDQISDEKVQKVLKTIIELKMIYDVDVVAEGVEHQEQLDNLQSIGCFLIQGYLYSKPKALR
ncbi:MAG: EAL domain-containing protein [Clostridia bacterium]|nr:EAL domain-containing protein [Clostridia bacterium]